MLRPLNHGIRFVLGQGFLGLSVSRPYPRPLRQRHLRAHPPDGLHPACGTRDPFCGGADFEVDTYRLYTRHPPCAHSYWASPSPSCQRHAHPLWLCLHVCRPPRLRSSRTLRRFSLPPAPAPAPPGPPMSIYAHLTYTELLTLSSSFEPSVAKARAEAFNVDGAVWAHGAAPAPASEPAALSTTAALAPATSAAASPVVTPSPLVKKNIFTLKGPSLSAARAIAALESVVPSLSAIAKAMPLPQKLVDVVPMPRVPEAKWVAVGAMRTEETGVPRAWSRKRKGREVAGWVPQREVCRSDWSLRAPQLHLADRRPLQRHAAWHTAHTGSPAHVPRCSRGRVGSAAAAGEGDATEEVIELLGNVEEAVDGKEEKGKRERAMEQRCLAAEEEAHWEEARTVSGEVGDGESVLLPVHTPFSFAEHRRLLFFFLLCTVQ
ncbi:hypothetical protein MVEN_02562900 [Mycena venus]|uniref:Uncharacterized protein n=1 Tax=Mycena venus TaxID=2733690 RepID=A0A8H6WSQ0_9AGAR|nr:hypothetical protein MVEN_02562900 [Mycena venus]